MKYMLLKIEMFEKEQFTIQTTENETDIIGFPAIVGNSSYDAFLIQARLTDAAVKKLTPDVWYDFPEALPVEPLVEEEAI